MDSTFENLFGLGYSSVSRRVTIMKSKISKEDEMNKRLEEIKSLMGDPFYSLHVQAVILNLKFFLDDNKHYVYCHAVIKSFRCSDTQKIFNREYSRRFTRDIQIRAFAKLNAIDAAVHLKDLRLPPSNRLEVLRGERKGQYSIRINDRWRICSRWCSGNAEDVEIVDYH